MSLAQGNNTPTRPRIEPGSPDPESDALTTRPVRPTSLCDSPRCKPTLHDPRVHPVMNAQPYPYPKNLFSSNHIIGAKHNNNNKPTHGESFSCEQDRRRSGSDVYETFSYDN